MKWWVLLAVGVSLLLSGGAIAGPDDGSGCGGSDKGGCGGAAVQKEEPSDGPCKDGEPGSGGCEKGGDSGGACRKGPSLKIERGRKGDGNFICIEISGDWGTIPQETRKQILDQLKNQLSPDDLKRVLKSLVEGERKIVLNSEGGRDGGRGGRGAFTFTGVSPRTPVVKTFSWKKAGEGDGGTAVKARVIMLGGGEMPKGFTAERLKLLVEEGGSPGAVKKLFELGGDVKIELDGDVEIRTEKGADADRDGRCEVRVLRADKVRMLRDDDGAIPAGIREKIKQALKGVLDDGALEKILRGLHQGKSGLRILAGFKGPHGAWRTLGGGHGGQSDRGCGKAERGPGGCGQAGPGSCGSGRGGASRRGHRYEGRSSRGCEKAGPSRGGGRQADRPRRGCGQGSCSSGRRGDLVGALNALRNEISALRREVSAMRGAHGAIRAIPLPRPIRVQKKLSATGASPQSGVLYKVSKPEGVRGAAMKTMGMMLQKGGQAKVEKDMAALKKELLEIRDAMKKLADQLEKLK